MLNSYFQVPALTASEFLLVDTAENTISKLRDFLPLAKEYVTVFSFAGKLYHTDVDGKKVERLYHEVGIFIPELPTEEKVVEKIVTEHVKIPTGTSEDLLIRAIAAASHQNIDKRQYENN